jgi:multiple sugar transport system ATP-binding protein
MNLMPGVVVTAGAQGAQVRLAGGAMVNAAVEASRLQPGEAVTLGLRAEHVLEGRAGSEVFQCQVQVVEHLGESNYLYAKLPDGSEVVLRGDGEHAVELGAPLTFSAPASAFHVFNGAGLAMRRLQPGNMLASSRGRSASVAPQAEGSPA